MSSNEKLEITLYPVKKEIHCIKDEWSPKSFLITFKLETDEEILIKKSLKSIEHAKSDYVVANILQTRYDRVLIINNEKKYELFKGDEHYIEEKLINKIVELHEIYMMNEE
jgi:phosphopantothenate-cysteine ligase